jgi:hypothetical protein
MVGALMITPGWSVHVSKREVRHFWRCENCGRAIEAVNLRFDGTSRLSKRVGLSVGRRSIHVGSSGIFRF